MLNYGFQTKTQCPYKFYLHIRYPEDRVIPVPVPAKTQQLLRQVAIDLHVTIYVFSNRSLSSIYYSDESCASIGLLHIQDSYDQVGEYTPLIAARKPPVNLQKERRVHPVQDPKAEYQTVHVRDPGQERPLLNVSIKWRPRTSQNKEEPWTWLQVSLGAAHPKRRSSGFNEMTWCANKCFYTSVWPVIIQSVVFPHLTTAFLHPTTVFLHSTTMFRFILFVFLVLVIFYTFTQHTRTSLILSFLLLLITETSVTSIFFVSSSGGFKGVDHILYQWPLENGRKWRDHIEFNAFWWQTTHLWVGFKTYGLDQEVLPAELSLCLIPSQC